MFVRRRAFARPPRLPRDAVGGPGLADSAHRAYSVIREIFRNGATTGAPPRHCGRSYWFAATTLRRHRLQHGDGQHGGKDVGPRRDDEHHVPTARRLLDRTSRTAPAGPPFPWPCRAGRRSLSRTWIRTCPCRSTGTDCRSRPRQRTRDRSAATNQNGSAPHRYSEIDADAFDAEGDEHRVLAPDMVGDPAEERPRETVQDAVDAWQRRSAPA